MNSKVQFSKDGKTLTVRVLMQFRRHGGRKVVMAPDGNLWAPSRPRIDNTIVKALARAFRWQKLLETGAFGTIAELARAEKINESYVGRLLRLTLLAPDIIESILDGRQLIGLRIDELTKPLPLCWDAQRRLFGAHK